MIGEPLSALAAEVSAAARDRRSVAMVGAGTKLGWGAVAPPADVTVSTLGLNALVEHRHGDLTATVQAGASLAATNQALARHGQWIALDPPFADRATIGGILATNDSGPRRHRFGAPRDNVIGVEIIRADGTLAKAGGIVVKNVAGYDVARLVTGSFGCLALIASATFKLYPLPPASRTVVVETADVAAVLTTLAASQLTPTAIELQTHPLRLLIRFESIEAAADEQAAHAIQAARGCGATTTLVADAEETALWAAHVERPWQGAGAIAKVALLPSDVAPTVAWLDIALPGVEWEAIGRAAVGVLLVRINADVAEQARAIVALRERVSRGRGSVVVVRASDALKRAVDVWGPPRDAFAVMRALKQQFDPAGVLNPGRGPFGL